MDENNVKTISVRSEGDKLMVKWPKDTGEVLLQVPLDAVPWLGTAKEEGDNTLALCILVGTCLFLHSEGRDQDCIDLICCADAYLQKSIQDANRGKAFLNSVIMYSKLLRDVGKGNDAADILLRLIDAPIMLGEGPSAEFRFETIMAAGNAYFSIEEFSNARSAYSKAICEINENAPYGDDLENWKAICDAYSWRSYAASLSNDSDSKVDLDLFADYLLGELGKLMGITAPISPQATNDQLADMFKSECNLPEINRLSIVAKHAMNLGMCYHDMGLFEEAVEITQIAINLYYHIAFEIKSCDDHIDHGLAASLNNLGAHLMGVGHNNAAKSSIKVSMDIAKKHNGNKMFEKIVAYSIANLKKLESS